MQTILFCGGLVLAMAGVGGVENSMDGVVMVQSGLVALAGLGLMAAGALGYDS